MTTLLVGFDSARTANHKGALVGVLHAQDGTFKELGSPYGSMNALTPELTITTYCLPLRPR